MRLEIGQPIHVKVEAKDIYGGEPIFNLATQSEISSGQIIEVLAGDVYNFIVEPNQEWCDSIVWTTAKGFNNIFLLFTGKRVKGAKCFTLCGVIAHDESTCFQIGSELLAYEMPIPGVLNFFPNDSLDHYHNNKGAIVLSVELIRSSKENPVELT